MAMAQSRERLRLWHEHAAWRALFSPDGEHVLTCSDDVTARLWTRRGELLHVMPHELWVVDCRFSHMGSRIATASRDLTAAIWSLDGTREHRLLHPARGRGHLFPAPTPEIARPGQVWSVRWSHDDKYLATTCSDKRIRIWDTETGVQFGPDFTEHENRQGWFCRLAWSPVTHFVVSCQAYLSPRHHDVQDTESIVFVWRPGAESHVIQARFSHPDAVNRVEFSPDGKNVLTACSDGRWRIWDLEDGR